MNTNSLIDTKAQNILDYWFEGNRFRKMWFSSKEDEYIKTNYLHLLLQAQNNELDHWKDCIDSYVALIILLDQFTRNIYRNTKKRNMNDKFALELTMEFLEKSYDESIPIAMKIFVLMPLRHTFNKYYYDIIFTKISKYTDSNEPIMIKFIDTTKRIYDKL